MSIWKLKRVTAMIRAAIIIARIKNTIQIDPAQSEKVIDLR
jgi:hypothetical protein